MSCFKHVFSGQELWLCELSCHCGHPHHYRVLNPGSSTSDPAPCPHAWEAAEDAKSWSSSCSYGRPRWSTMAMTYPEEDKKSVPGVWLPTSLLLETANGSGSWQAAPSRPQMPSASSKSATHPLTVFRGLEALETCPKSHRGSGSEPGPG